jgi:hypothetical protein
MGGGMLGTFPLQLGAGTAQPANPPDTPAPSSPWGAPSTDRER